jgi:uncharacterized integral membrane protein
MRLLSFLFLVVIVGALGLFASENSEAVSVQFWSWRATYSLALVLGAAFVLGMLGGWSILGAVRRSAARVTDRRYD